MRLNKPLLVSIELLVLTSCLFAQSTPPAAPIPTFKTSTTNVIVDVVVTSPHETPVEGLTQDNFEVLENGHPQKVVSVIHHPSIDAPVAPAKALPPGTYTNAQTVSGDLAADVLLLDALNTPVTGQAQAHKALIEYLKTLPLNQPVAVFTLDTQLHQLADFTTDHTALLKAVEAFARTPHRSDLLKTAKDTEQ